MQFFQRKRYRFFYPAGVISLVLLPLLGYFYLYQQEVFQQKYVIELNFWHPSMSSFWGDPRKVRNWKVIELDGQTTDAQKLHQLQLEVKNLFSTKDTIHGINVVFGPKAKYNSMVEGYNICLKEKVKYWAAYQNNIWIFHKNPRPSIPYTDLGSCLLYNDIEVAKPEISYSSLLFNEWDETKVALKSAKRFWPAAILYLIMLSLTTRKLVRDLQNQPRTTSNQQL